MVDLIVLGCGTYRMPDSTRDHGRELEYHATPVIAFGNDTLLGADDPVIHAPVVVQSKIRLFVLACFAPVTGPANVAQF